MVLYASCSRPSTFRSLILHSQPSMGTIISSEARQFGLRFLKQTTRQLLHCLSHSLVRPLSFNCIPWRQSFQGSSFGLYGNDFNDNFRVSIDNGASFAASTERSFDKQTHQRWYQSPNLAQGSHSVTISGIHGIAFDYLLITPGSNTPLRNKKLMIDDAYSAIQYSGSGWKVSGDLFAEDDKVQMVPFQNAVHRTSNVGDSLTFTYTGALKIFD